MSEDEQWARKQKIFRACMYGLMVASGTFLALRYLFSLGVDPSLIAGAGVGVAVGMHLLQMVDRG
jgi:hypothetical protein